MIGKSWNFILHSTFLLSSHYLVLAPWLLGRWPWKAVFQPEGALDQRTSTPKCLGCRARYASHRYAQAHLVSWPNSIVLPFLRRLLMHSFRTVIWLSKPLTQSLISYTRCLPDLSIRRWTKNSRSCKPGQQALEIYCTRWEWCERGCVSYMDSVIVI